MEKSSLYCLGLVGIFTKWMVVKRQRVTAGHGLPVESGGSFTEGLVFLGINEFLQCKLLK